MQSQDMPDLSNPPTMLNDFAGILNDEQTTFLENQLRSLNTNTKVQVAIVIVDNIGDYDIADYAVKLGRKWGIGNDDLGLLILIATSNRKIWFATGRRIEQYLPDVVCRRIIQEQMKPYFKETKYYLGIQNAFVEVVKNLQQSYDGNDEKVINFYSTFLEEIKNGSTELRKKYGDTPPPSLLKSVLILVVVLVVVIIFSKMRGGGGGAGMIIGSGLMGGFGGGSGSGGGGFGGGGFGGGGAGGSW